MTGLGILVKLRVSLGTKLVGCGDEGTASLWLTPNVPYIVEKKSLPTT
jgi:hypothetical protein